MEHLKSPPLTLLMCHLGIFFLNIKSKRHARFMQRFARSAEVTKLVLILLFFPHSIELFMGLCV